MTEDIFGPFLKRLIILLKAIEFEKVYDFEAELKALVDADDRLESLLR